MSVRNGYAPASLTKDQLFDIFTCEVSDWSQVGGQKGAIHLYFAPSTAATFTEFLKGFGTDYNSVVAACKTSGRLFLNQQNDGRTLHGDPQGIAGYALTKWAGQANGGNHPELDLGIPDLRAGTTVGKINDNVEPIIKKTVGGNTFDVLNGDWTSTNGRSTFGRILWNAVRNSAAPQLKALFDQDSWLCAHRDELITPFGATPLGGVDTPDADGRYCGQAL